MLENEDLRIAVHVMIAIGRQPGYAIAPARSDLGVILAYDMRKVRENYRWRLAAKIFIANSFRSMV